MDRKYPKALYLGQIHQLGLYLGQISYHTLILGQTTRVGAELAVFSYCFFNHYSLRFFFFFIKVKILLIVQHNLQSLVPILFLPAKAENFDQSVEQ